MEAGIPWRTLPKTFQDAITVTRQMGVQYLWIDSLCILQGDKTDWDLHVSLMGSIYENSFFTIAAADARDSRGGCFLRHDHKQVRVSIGDDYAIHARPSPELQGFDERWADGANHAPAHWRHCSVGPQEISDQKAPTTKLEDRCWAFQERLLSPRTLHFSRYELAFECRESIRCECTKQETRPSRHLKSLFKGLSQLSLSVPRGRSAEAIRNQWFDIVESYSRRTLTFPTDRLPALAGIATQFASHHRITSRYCAGLWELEGEEHIIHSLLWRTFLGFNPHAHPNRRCDEYLGPSWSWVSILGTVEFPYRDAFDQILAHDVRVETEVQTPLNPHGAVHGGYIDLQASLIPIFIEKSPTSLHKLSLKSASLWSPNQVIDVQSFRQSLTLYEDISSILHDDVGTPEMTDGTRADILPLALQRERQEGDSAVAVLGLVVRGTRSSSIFERIGLARISGAEEVWSSWAGLGVYQAIRLR